MEAADLGVGGGEMRRQDARPDATGVAAVERSTKEEKVSITHLLRASICPSSVSDLRSSSLG